jgi:hypothetical protein
MPRQVRFYERHKCIPSFNGSLRAVCLRLILCRREEALRAREEAGERKHQRKYVGLPFLIHARSVSVSAYLFSCLCLCVSLLGTAILGSLTITETKRAS